MKVDVVQFPLTQVAVIEHFGSSETESQSVLKLINWRKEKGFLDQQKNKSFGIHYTNPKLVLPEFHHVDFCVSVNEKIATNAHGVINKTIPSLRCARARDIGSRYDNQAIVYLIESWLPQVKEVLGDFPPIFHYVNIGVDLREEEMITDVYLPLA